MKTLKRILKAIGNTIIFLFGVKNSDIRKEAEQDGVCKYGNQGLS